MDYKNIDSCLAYMKQFNIPITGRNFLNELKKYFTNTEKINLSRIYSYIQTNGIRLIVLGDHDNYSFSRANNIVNYYNEAITALKIQNNQSIDLSLELDRLDKYFK